MEQLTLNKTKYRRDRFFNPFPFPVFAASWFMEVMASNMYFENFSLHHRYGGLSLGMDEYGFGYGRTLDESHP